MKITQQKTDRTRTCIPDYVGWVNGKPFHQTPIKITYGGRIIAQIKKYISTENRKKNTTRRKYGLAGAINNPHGRCQTGKIEDIADRLQKEAGQNNMQPIRDSQRRLRIDVNAKHIAIKKTDDAECQGMGEAMEIWEEWTAECISKKKGQLKPKISHIHDIEWGKEIQVTEDLQTIRRQAEITKIIQEEPGTETWLNQEYAEQDINRELRNATNRKAHGRDGIPGEAYKETREWATKPITRITNAIKEGHAIPENWTNGTIAYIYKNQGGPDEWGELQTHIPNANHM